LLRCQGQSRVSTCGLERQQLGIDRREGSNVLASLSEHALELVQPAFRGVDRPQLDGPIEALYDGEKGTVWMVGRALQAPQNVLLRAQAIGEGADQARFSDARLPSDQHNLAFTGLGQLPTLQQEGKFVNPPNKARQDRTTGGIKTALEVTSAENTEKAHFAVEAFEGARAKLLDVERLADQDGFLPISPADS